jgi:hypothetical protein
VVVLAFTLSQGRLPAGVVRPGQRVGGLEVFVAEGKAAQLVAERMETVRRVTRC